MLKWSIRVPQLIQVFNILCGKSTLKSTPTLPQQIQTSEAENERLTSVTGLRAICVEELLSLAEI